MRRLSEAALLTHWSHSITGEPADEDELPGSAEACCPTCGQAIRADLRLDAAAGAAYGGGGYTLLAPMEFALLVALHNSGRNWLARPTAVDAVWKNRGLEVPKSVKNSLANLALLLRKQLRPLGLTIMACPTRGYRLTILRP